MAFVYGVDGKSALLNAFASGVRRSGTQVWSIDAAAIDPTESSFRAALDAPMLEWSTERGRGGGLEILPLVGLTDEAARAFLADASVPEDHADLICRVARGHPSCRRSNSGS